MLPDEFDERYEFTLVTPWFAVGFTRLALNMVLCWSSRTVIGMVAVCTLGYLPW